MLKRRILAVLAILATIPVLIINNDITFTVLITLCALPVIFAKNRREKNGKKTIS